MFKIQNKMHLKTPMPRFLFLSFEFLSLEFVLDFDIRISDLITDCYVNFRTQFQARRLNRQLSLYI